MLDRFSRTRLLLGGEGMERLQKARVAVFGLGGVGGYVCEALARSGIGALDLIDHDQVSLTNINRQIIALEKTVGRDKCDVMRERILDINPEAEVRVWKTFVLPENIREFPFAAYDYAVDALDTMAAKIAIVEEARRTGVPVISSMGTGNKRDPGRLRITDLFETETDPLSRVMRREMRRRGIDSLKVLSSDEPPLKPKTAEGEEQEIKGRNRPVPGSTAFVPPAAGLLIAAEVVRELTEAEKGTEKNGK